jgi:hypothetical protein
MARINQLGVDQAPIQTRAHGVVDADESNQPGAATALTPTLGEATPP